MRVFNRIIEIKSEFFQDTSFNCDEFYQSNMGGRVIPTIFPAIISLSAYFEEYFFR